MKNANIQNIENLLNGVWSGRLEHNQQAYSCDTAKCIAGWDIALNCKDSTLDLIIEEGNPWAWSRDNNNLTEAEATLLFHGNSNKETHELTLKALKAGRRLDIEVYNIEYVDKEDNPVFVNEAEGVLYYLSGEEAIDDLEPNEFYDKSSVLIIVMDDKDAEALYQFLGEGLVEASTVSVETIRD